MKEKTYSFRDTKHILDRIDKGYRSKFIRESLERNVKSYQELYKEELEEYNEFISFYQKQDEKYAAELDELKKIQKNLRDLKRQNSIKLNKTIKETQHLVNLLEINDELTVKDELIVLRRSVCETVVKFIIRNRSDLTADIDLDFLKEKGRFISKKELIFHVHDYVNKHVNLGSHIANVVIDETDIHYIKKKINEL